MLIFLNRNACVVSVYVGRGVCRSIISDDGFVMQKWSGWERGSERG